MNKYSIIIFFVAFCSFTYELIFAELLAATNGGTILNYSLTIGLYVASAGLGAYYFQRKKQNNKKLFVKVEGLISQLSYLGVFFIIFLTMLWLREPIFPKSIIVFIPVIIIGFLTGIELPLLVSLSKKRFSTVLYITYVGNMVAALLFPLFLFRTFGLIETVIMISFLNLALAIYMGFKQKYLTKTLTIVGIIHIILLINMFWIQEWIMLNFV